MRILEFLGICISTLLVLLFALFVRRRLLMRGGGTIGLQVRVHTLVPGRGWSAGIGQFAGDELRFHRMFSFAIRPKRVLNRRELSVDRPRLPEGAERRPIPEHWVVLRCTTPGSCVDIAMAESTVTGFLSWLEAGPPGSTARRPAVAPRPVDH
ncbi:DUF2550 domain-containing protein [Krasilnikovia sp. MM14-A1259]|uniref:DUF2550 domain-containing protein n=1 Tax=Krasilnikovia sp. MM14-A1259 TaxID=3373539 RepID=UPI00381CE443